MAQLADASGLNPVRLSVRITPGAPRFLGRLAERPIAPGLNPVWPGERRRERSNRSPSATSPRYGAMPERPNGADSKSDGRSDAAPGFESLALLHPLSIHISVAQFRQSGGLQNRRLKVRALPGMPSFPRLGRAVEGSSLQPCMRKHTPVRIREPCPTHFPFPRVVQLDRTAGFYPVCRRRPWCGFESCRAVHLHQSHHERSATCAA